MSICRSKSLQTVIAVMSGLVLDAAQRPQLIRFFTTADCRPATGVGAPFQEYQLSGNISAQTFQSYCVVRGAWRVEYSWVQSESDFNISIGDGCASCISKGTTSRRYGYIQRIGGSDLSQASLSLYSDANFMGNEAFVNGREYSFNETYSFTSLAFSSFSNWTWQVYYLPRFRGSSVCYTPNLKSEVTIINHSTVNAGSIRLGCRNSGNSLHYSGVIALTAFLLLQRLPSFHG